MAQLFTDHYAVLGVGRAASREEIRRAYIEKIKAHTPEEDPDTFRLVSEAYRILSNPVRRKAYDAEARFPPGVRERLDELTMLADLEPKVAARKLYGLAQENPDVPAIRFQYGVLLDRLGRPRDAVAVFQRLFDEDPNSASFATWLGDAMVRSGQEDRGEQYLKEAIVLDRHSPLAYSALARHWAAGGRTGDALEILERGIHADEQVGLTDLSLFVQRLFILARTEAWDGLEDEARRVVALAPEDDPEGRQYVASQLWQVVGTFQEQDRPDLMVVIVDAILTLDPDNQELRETAGELRRSALVLRQLAQLLVDPAVPEWLREFVGALTSKTMKKRAARKALRDVAARSGIQGTPMRIDWRTAKRRYPQLLAELEDAWEGIQRGETPLRARRAWRRRKSSKPDEGNCSVGCLIAAVVLLYLLGKGCS